MNNIKITMKMFGAMRNYGNTLEFHVSSGSTVSAIKDALAEQLKPSAHGLIRDSVLADETAVLEADQIIEHDSFLSILPPVCGG